MLPHRQKAVRGKGHESTSQLMGAGMLALAAAELRPELDLLHERSRVARSHPEPLLDRAVVRITHGGAEETALSAGDHAHGLDAPASFNTCHHRAGIPPPKACLGVVMGERVSHQHRGCVGEGSRLVRGMIDHLAQPEHRETGGQRVE